MVGFSQFFEVLTPLRISHTEQPVRSVFRGCALTEKGLARQTLHGIMAIMDLVIDAAVPVSMTNYRWSLHIAPSSDNLHL